MKITNSVCETNLNREWRADFEFDQGGRILRWENLKSRLATPLVFDRLTSNGWGGKSPTSDRTYPSLTTTEGQKAQRAKFCKYVIQDQWTLTTTRSLLLNVWTLNVVKWHSSKVFFRSDLIRVIVNFFTGRGTNILRSSKLCVTKDTGSPKLSSTDSWLAIPSEFVWGRCRCITCLSFTSALIRIQILTGDK